MLKKTFIISCVSVALAISAVLLLLPTPATNNTLASGILLIENATVFNGEKFINNINIEISGGLIKSMKPTLQSNAEHRIDATDKTLIPGLIDAHTHSFDTALEAALNFGVTTQIDMFTSPVTLKSQIAVRQSNTQFQQADLFSAGMLATVEGGHGTQFGIPLDTLSSPNDAKKWVEKRIEEGSDFIKLVYMPYSKHFKSLDRKTSAAIIKATHNKGLKAVAHISTQRAAQELLEDGIDGFVHIFADEKVNSEFIALAKANDIFVIPTLSVIASATHKKLGEELANDSAITEYLQTDQVQQLQASFGDHQIPGFELSIALHNTRRLHNSGIRILAGSDAPNPGTTYGASIHQELELLVQAGLSPSQAINAASRVVAQTFNLNAHNLSPRGRLVVGAKADFIILESSPLNNIKATRNIAGIYKNGVKLDRVKTAQLNAKKISTPQLSDFTNGLSSQSNLTWSKTDDSMLKGSSLASIQVEENTLKVTAAINKGFMFPWAGATVFGDTKRNISAYSIVSFNIRGTPGKYQAMIFSGMRAGTPPSQSFSVNNEWQTIQLSLSKFNGLDTAQFSGLAIVSGPSLGEFEYYLDDVKLIK